MKVDFCKISVVVLFILFALSSDAQAFFEDSEKTKKNLFKAGMLDMKIDGADPFVQRNVVEGDEFFQEFYLKNKGTIDFDYKIFTENVSGDLCGQLNIKAKAEGEEIFDGKLEDFSYSDNLKAKKNINWNLELKVGDGDWEEKCKFDVYFNAWQKNFSFKQGWNDAEEISGNEVVFIDEPKKKVIINEVMWMGSTASSSDEWIELRNLSDEKIDIGGWEIENARSSGNSLKIPGGKSIDSNGYFLISNYSDESANSALAVEVDEVNSSISLSNFGNGNLVLKNEKENIEDEVMGVEWFFGENGNNKKSMERNNEYGNGLEEKNWHTCEREICASGYFWDNPEENFGTPGEKNSDIFKIRIEKPPNTRR